MLWRAFKDVENGFYIDVGAQHPVIDSVSKAFYEKGWRGVHVEPVPEFADLLKADRPDEDVLQLALGNHSGVIPLFSIPGTGLSTQDQATAHRHLDERSLASVVLQVPVLSAKVALKKYAGRTLHWLKIDVEGAERDVLEGWNFKDLSPMIVLIEATEPNRQVKTHHEWEHLLLSKKYEFAYWDGLNRFYVRSDMPQLKNAFDSPPNVFDGAALAGSANAPWHTKIAHDARQQVQSLQQVIDVMSQDIGQVKAEHERECDANLAVLQQSQRELLEQRKQQVDTLHAHADELSRLHEQSLSQLGQTESFKAAALLAEQSCAAELSRALTLESSLAAERQHFSTQSEAFHAQIADLEARSASAAQQHESLRTEILKLHENLAVAEQQLLSARQANDTLEQSLATAREQSDRMQVQYKQQVERLDGAITEKDSLLQLAITGQDQLRQAFDAERQQFIQQVAKMQEQRALEDVRCKDLIEQITRIRAANDQQLAELRTEVTGLAKWFASTMRDLSASAVHAAVVHANHIESVMRDNGHAVDQLRFAHQRDVEAASAAAHRDRQALEGLLAASEQQLADANRYVDSLVQSKSWRYTKFVRNILSVFD